VDGHKRIHLLWGETQSPPATFAKWPLIVTELWHSVYDGRAWSAPERVTTRDGLRWGIEGQVVVDARDVIHVMVPVVTNAGTQPVAHLRLNEGRWDARDIPTFATNATVVSLSPDSLLAVLLGVGTTGKARRDALLLTRSADGGSTWSVPNTIESLSRAPGRNPLLRAARGQVHLVWLQSRSDVLGDEAIAYAMSVDAGRTWSQSVGQKLPAMTLSHSFMLDRCNQPLGVASQFDGGRLRLFGFWRSADSLILHPEYVSFTHATEPAISGPSRPTLIWTGSRSPNGAATLLYSSLAACACSRRG
jgi:hypothetical protein